MTDRANNHAIEAVELTKQFDHFTAVDQIRFTVHRGEIFGFLGPYLNLYYYNIPSY